MAKEVIMPKAGSEMEEGEIVKWFKNEGDKVTAGEPLLEIVTDKVNMEVEAEDSGILLKILHKAGEIVPVVTTIAYIGEQGEKIEEEKQDIIKEEKQEVEQTDKPVEFIRKKDDQITYTKDDLKILRATPAARNFAKKHNINLLLVKGSGEKGRVHKEDVVLFKKEGHINASPLARRIAEIEGVNLKVISGTGPNGKIMKSDVMNLLHGVEVEEKPVIEEKKPIPVSEVHKKTSRWGEIETVPMSPMRKVIAKRMSDSYFTAPTFVVNVEVDMTNLLDFRKKVIDNIMEDTGKKATVTDFISFAVIKALMKHPYVNSSLSEDGKEMYLNHFVNLSIAVGMDTGLLTPVIKGADKMTLKELVVASKEMTTKALNGKLKPDEMAESTFTISNLGMYGVESFIPIINQPNSAILGVSATVKKPVVVNDEIVVRPIMKLTLTADHRVVDGLEAAKFMQTLKGNIENPISLLI